MRKVCLLLFLTLLAIGLFAKGTCEPSTKSSVSTVFDLSTARKATSMTDDLKTEIRVNKKGSREWQIVKEETFEGAWPNDWNCYSASDIDCYWSDHLGNCTQGSWSGWCADGGSEAPAEQIYPNYMDTWMVYGPFSLADAIDAGMYWDGWYQTESGFDSFSILASVDGVSWFGDMYDGDSGGWIDMGFDLTDVYELGDVTGLNQIWIAFRFYSDYSIAYEGVYVDWITIQKDYDAPVNYGAPEIWDTYLANEIDSNNNGFYESFSFEVDVDGVSSSDATYRAEDCYISVYRDDTGAFLGEWGPFSFNDQWVSDNVIVGPFYDLVGTNTYDFSFTIWVENDLGSDSDNILVDVEAGNVSNDDDFIVSTTSLMGNYPNPFNPTTSINYNLTENGNVSLKIYNVKGELVRTLLSQEQAAGNHSVVWDGNDNNGIQASSGIYFYNMKTAVYSSTKRMIMLK